MQNLSVLTMKPLGQQLVESGLLSEPQLEQALKQQKSQPDRLLGQILVESGLLLQQEFDQFMQTRMSIQQPLGELLIHKQVISRDELNKALGVQMQAGPAPKPLGQLLVEQGSIEQELLDSIIQQQYQEQEALREKMTRQGQEKSPYERSQVEDIQNLLSTSVIFLAMGQELLPDDSKLFAERFEKMQFLHQGKRLSLPESMRETTASFMVHFLPVLEMGFQLEGQNDDEAESRNQIVNLGFYALLEGFKRMLLPEMRLFSNFYLNSLIMTEAADIVSLREALYIAARSPYLMPHGSLMALRFLLNEFWGQRSILEQKGMQIVRNEDEVDLSDFFRPRMEDMDEDMAYVEYMESYIYDQIEYSAVNLRNAPDEELESRLAELMNYYRVLMQTHKDAKLRQSESENSE